MSATATYQVSARKYRPRTFHELVGQDAMVKTLQGAIDRSRIPHAYILTGVRGVGKTTTARLLARGLNCVGPDGTGKETTNPCGVCDPCQQILQESHLDIIEVDAASRTGVEDMRDLIDGVSYKPVAARYKIYIIDEVHMLSKSAFNALLKTLEEPPAHVKFFFATTEINKVPVTILSRCQRFDLRRVGPEVMVPFLQGILEKEKMESETEALTLIAHASEGSVRDALSLLDQAMNLADKKLTAGSVEKMLGRISPRRVIALLDLLFEGNTQESLRVLEEVYDQGAEPLAIIELLLEVVHQLTLSKVSPGTMAPLFQGAGDAASVLLEKVSVPLLSRAWQLLLKGRQEIGSLQGGQLALQMLFVRFCYLQDVPPIATLLKTLDQDPAGVSGREGLVKAAPVETRTPAKISAQSVATSVTVNAPAAVQSAPPKKADPETPEGVQTFEALLNLLDHHKEALLMATLEQSLIIVEYAPGVLRFGYKGDMPDTFIPQLRKVLAGITGMNWDLTHEREATGETRQEQQRRQVQEQIDAIKETPEVKSVLEAFPGAVVEKIEPKEDVS